MTTNTHIAARLRDHAEELASAPVEYCRHTGNVLACLLLEAAQALEAAEQDKPDLTLVYMAGEHAGRKAAEASPALDAQGEALKEMEARKDAAYLERNQVVAALASAYPSGIARTAIEGWSEDWHGCVYIDLPTGQASWHYHDSQAHLFAHLPSYTGSWDGHSTEEKYQRLARLSSTPPPPAVGKPLSLAVIQEWAARRVKALGPEGITDPIAFLEEGVRWGETQHGIVTKETGT